VSYAVLAFAAACDTIVLAAFMLTSLLPLHFRHGTSTIPLLSLAVVRKQAAIAAEIAAAGAEVNAFFA
jgi:hypothetical protein